MVAILSKIFGLTNLSLIEDAIQDTFLQAALKWRNNQPDNPEAWLTQAAKNRTVDLLRQINAQKERHDNIINGAVALEINDYFLAHEVEDSQLRMIFVACHPIFSTDEQIAFALKTISGFSLKEIAAALLQKEETIKKRLARARKKIQESNITLAYPHPNEIQSRISSVLQIIYLIFNEGFQSTKKDQLINKDLCGEALRLCKLLLIKENFRTGSLYALFALLCFHASRLEAKIESNEIIDLKNQDRSKWHLPLIILGNDALNKANEYDDYSLYHLEAAIAAEHVRAIKFENTNWTRIIDLYDEMYKLMPSTNFILSKAIALMQVDKLKEAKSLLDKVDIEKMPHRKHLIHGAFAEYYTKKGELDSAATALDQAIEHCSNEMEKNYLIKKKNNLRS
ncbi:sigma-70 family RNA polymerase sigma factor [Fulvivirga lutimaris]|nr:sigma-70 family RNA polymerase sigma factor [Fulvivirga lutimaris]